MDGHQRMETVWAWVCTDSSDGTEGVPAAGLEGDNGETLIIPLFGTKRSVVERMRPTAEALVKIDGHKMALVEFTARITHEVIEP